MSILKGIIEEPSNEKLRKIKVENPMIKKDVTDLVHGSDLLIKLGFDEIDIEEKKENASKKIKYSYKYFLLLI